MGTYHLQVSSHAKIVSGRAKYDLPDNFTFKAYVPSGKELEWNASVGIYANLIKGDRATSKVVHTVFGGNSIDDYALWDLKDSNYKSGVLSDDRYVVKITGSTEVSPRYLSEVMAEAVRTLTIKDTDEVIIYFNACRG